MINTGRIKKPVPRNARSVVFGTSAEHAISDTLPMIAMIDQSQLLMLERAGLVDRSKIRRLLRVIEDIQKHEFEALREKEPVRGVYLLWEKLLADMAGDDLAGLAHLGRSRNDLNATLLRMRLRKPVSRLLLEAIRLGITLLTKAGKFLDCITVGYTQYQPAMPLTLGHQLLAWATALSRDIDAILRAATDLDRSPLGAGALAGTSLPIDTKYTAGLLGFSTVASNSLDAVASRDFALRLLTASSILAVTISRIATDLLLMTTQEFGFIELPDEMVGSSSQMPQKRNPFLLELSQSRGMLAMGTFVTAGSSMHGVPFSNSVAAGTEAVRGVADALRGVIESVFLLRQTIVRMKPLPRKMHTAAKESFVTAAALAERIALTGKRSLRSAHHLVGRMVNQAAEESHPLVEVAGRELAKYGLKVDLTGLDPQSIALAADQGGGPGLHSTAAQLKTLWAHYKRLRRKVRFIRNKYRMAKLHLQQEVQRILHE